MYRGPDSSEQQVVRENCLSSWRDPLRTGKIYATRIPPSMLTFSWSGKSGKNHMVIGLPSYVFYFICCYSSDCPHPRCQDGTPQHTLTWFPGVPPLTHLPLPFLDAEHPWGIAICSIWRFLFRTLHYSTHWWQSSLLDWSVILSSENYFILNEDQVQRAVKKVLLPPEECKFCCSICRQS